MFEADKGQPAPLDGSRLRIGIVQARFNEGVTNGLRDACLAELAALGVKRGNIAHHTVPGALEVPAVIALAEEAGRFPTAPRYDGYVALGCVIRGETYHFEIVAGESARGIMALTMDGIAIGNGILTVENERQAIERADPGQKDKGGEAAKAALALYELRGRFGN